MHSKESEKKQKQQRKKPSRRKKVAHTAKEKLSPRQSGTLSLAKNSIFIRKTCNRNWMYLWDCKKRNEMKIKIEKKRRTIERKRLGILLKRIWNIQITICVSALSAYFPTYKSNITDTAMVHRILDFIRYVSAREISLQNPLFGTHIYQILPL